MNEIAMILWVWLPAVAGMLGTYLVLTMIGRVVAFGKEGSR